MPRMQGKKLIKCVSFIKKNIFSPLQVKNKPRDGETEHAFILGSMDCMVSNIFKYKAKVFLNLTRVSVD